MENLEISTKGKSHKIKLGEMGKEVMGGPHHVQSVDLRKSLQQGSAISLLWEITKRTKV